MSSVLTRFDLCVRSLNTEALGGLQGLRGVIAVIAPRVWVSGGADPTEVRMRRVVQTVRDGNLNKGKLLAVFCHKGTEKAPRAVHLKVANSFTGDDDASCPKGGARVSGNQDCG